MAKKRNFKHYIRKSHRFLGVFIGIQFLCWTLGGLYFSWTDIDEIHGDHFRNLNTEINFQRDLISPKIAIDEIKRINADAKVLNIRAIEISGTPFYEFTVEDIDKTKRLIAADALSGKIRPNVTKEEAEKIAAESLAKPLTVKEISYLTKDNVGGHHEYREKPLPAWVVTYDNDLMVYVSAETGQIGAFRTNKWRIFDFLWMLHTMDYDGRDNINNYFLRGFSILGIVTILSGFLLFFVSSKLIRKLLSRRISSRVDDPK